MAVLTWQQVANPSFGGANDMFRTGAMLQGNALNRIGEAIDRQRQDQQSNVDSQVLARALQVNDPAEYRKQLAAGSFLSGVDPSQVSARALAALGARSGDLVTQANRQSAQAARDYTLDRTMSQDMIADAARGEQAQRLGLTGALAQLSPEQQRQVIAQETAIAGGKLGNINRAFQNYTQKRDDDAAEVGLNTATNVMRQSDGPLAALANLEQMNDLTPREYAEANRLLSGIFGNLYAPAGQPTGAKGAAGTRQGSPYDTTFNFQGTEQPISSMPISGVLQVQEQSRTSQGHSPMGAFQINKATLEDFGPRVLGKDWKDQEFTPEAQEKVARAIFEDRKGGDLTKTWASLPNSSPGAYKNFSWDDMRSLIAQGEVGQGLPSDRASLNLLSQAAQQDIGRRVAQNNAVGVTADIQRNLSDTRAAGEVVQDLIKNQFPGADAGDLQGLISRIRRSNPSLSAADAGSIIARSVQNSAWYTPGTTTFGDGVGVNDATLRQNAQDYATGKADRSALANQFTQQQSQKLATAQQNYDQAYQNLIAATQRQQIQPGISTERVQAAFDRAEAALKRALAQSRQDPANRPVR